MNKKLKNNGNTATLIIGHIHDFQLELDANEYEAMKCQLLPEKQAEINALQAELNRYKTAVEKALEWIEGVREETSLSTWQNGITRIEDEVEGIIKGEKNE